MATSVKCYFRVIVVFGLIILKSDGYTTKRGSYVVESSGSAKKMNHDSHVIPIKHFARNILCNNSEGKKRLYRAVKTKVCGTSLTLVQSIVLDVCRRKNYMLDKWVKELFDIDGNNVISHHERNLFT